MGFSESYSKNLSVQYIMLVMTDICRNKMETGCYKGEVTIQKIQQVVI